MLRSAQRVGLEELGPYLFGQRSQPEPGRASRRLVASGTLARRLASHCL